MIKRLARMTLGILVTAIGAFGVGVVSSAPAQATDYACGFTPIVTGNIGSEGPNYERGVYNNCSDQRVRINVEYAYASDSRCVSPGNTRLYASSSLGALRDAVLWGNCADIV